MLDHHVVAVVGQRTVDVIDPRNGVQEVDGISDAILEIETINVRLERFSEFIDALYNVRMVVRKLLEHGDHVVLIGIHETLGVHLRFAHREQLWRVGRCACASEIVTVDDGFDQRRRFNDVTLWDVLSQILIVLVEDDEVSLVLSFGEQHVLPLFFRLFVSFSRCDNTGCKVEQQRHVTAGLIMLGAMFQVMTQSLVDQP